MNGKKGQAGGPASGGGGRRGSQADHKEIGGLKLQIEALNEKIQDWEQYGRRKDRQYEQLEKKYEQEKKHRQHLEKKYEQEKKHRQHLEKKLETLGKSALEAAASRP